MLVTTTVKNRSEARQLARAILNSRLAACVQWIAIQSLYWWKGVVEQANEFLLLAKTRRELADNLTHFVRSHHAYEIPEITVIPIERGLSEYLQWIEAETQPMAPRLKHHRTSKP